MGMSASQARLLFISSRINDIEMKSQNIANQKIRLASESDQIANDYANALNKTKFVYDGLNANGDRVSKDLSYSEIMSPEGGLSSKFVLTDANNRPVVPASVANAYDGCNGNPRTYLLALGVDSSGVEQVTRDTDPYTYTWTTQEQVTSREYAPELFEVELNNYINSQEVLQLINAERLNFAQSKYGILENEFNVEKLEPWRANILSRAEGLSTIDSAKFFKVLNDDNTLGDTELKSLAGKRLTQIADFEVSDINTDDIVNLDVKAELQRNYIDTMSDDAVLTIMDGLDSTQKTNLQTALGIKSLTKNTDDGGFSVTLASGAIKSVKFRGDDSGETLNLAGNFKAQYINGNFTFTRANAPVVNMKVDKYLQAFPTMPAISTYSLPTKPVLASFDAKKSEFFALYDSNLKPNKLNLLRTNWSNLHRNDNAFYRDVVRTEEVVHSEVRYGGSETVWETNSSNPDTQFYMKLFNDMQSAGGYAKHPETGAAYNDQALASKEMLQYMLETGGWFISARNEDGTLAKKSIAEITSITEVSDKEGIAKAEAEYNAKSRKLNNKEKILDRDLKQLDTEHSALETERESMKQIIKDNIDKSFNMFS